MKTNKYPSRYYIFLLLGLLITILFWFFLFSYLFRGQKEIAEINNDLNNRSGYFADEDLRQYRESLPEEIGEIEIIDSSEIISDSLSGRQIVGNLVNIAIKDENVKLKDFILDFFKKFDKEKYKIVYADTIINRVQIKLAPEVAQNFKKQIKVKMSNYKLLVWDEVLFQNGYVFNDKKLNDQNCSWYFDAINIENAWRKTKGKPEIVIAVIDNGFDLNHPELRGKSIMPYNVVDKSRDVRPVRENHGTHVAATIIGNANNNLGLVGIAPNCRFMPIKAADQNGNISNTYIIDAILYAIKNKVSVINLSLGMALDPSFQIPLDQQEEYIDYYGKDEEEFWNEVFEYANDKNVTCVLAAGNNNMLTGFDPFQRSKFTIKVGAVDQRMRKAGFSNYGEFTDIYAPGVHIYSAKPNGGFEFLDGTSMASPIVAGAVGLLKSKKLSLKNQQIVELIKKTSKKVNNMKIINVQSLLE